MLKHIFVNLMSEETKIIYSLMIEELLRDIERKYRKYTRFTQEKFYYDL